MFRIESYEGRHRDDSPDAQVRNHARDLWASINPRPPHGRSDADGMTYYRPRHANLSPEALAVSRTRDLTYLAEQPFRHHQARHSAFVAKKRVTV